IPYSPKYPSLKKSNRPICPDCKSSSPGFVGIKGVWFAESIKDQPRQKNIRTTASMTITNMQITNEDTAVPMNRRSDSKQTIITAGRLINPVSVSPVAVSYVSQGPCNRNCGIFKPKPPRNLLKYCDQLTATVAAPKAYSRTRSQPIIHATHSPIVAYEYVYALPATGIIEATSA